MVLSKQERNKLGPYLILRGQNPRMHISGPRVLLRADILRAQALGSVSIMERRTKKERERGRQPILKKWWRCQSQQKPWKDPKFQGSGNSSPVQPQRKEKVKDSFQALLLLKWRPRQDSGSMASPGGHSHLVSMCLRWHPAKSLLPLPQLARHRSSGPYHGLLWAWLRGQ